MTKTETPTPAAPARLSSGIDSLDEILSGGFIERTCTLVTIDTGTGRTTLAL